MIRTTSGTQETTPGAYLPVGKPAQKLLRKLWALGKRFVRSPIRTVRDLPDLFESLRMRWLQDSTFRCDRHVLDAASNCPSRMLAKALEIWRPHSVLDVGCGTGRVLDFLLSKGVKDVLGLEGSPSAIGHARQPQLIRQVDLSKPLDLGRQFDLVYSVEVAEHIRPEAARQFVRICTEHGRRVIFTAARPGQGGLGHLNEQHPEYWIRMFAEEGFTVDEPAMMELVAVGDIFAENLIVFEQRKG